MDVSMTPEKYTYMDMELFKRRFIDTWKPVSEVWAFKFGDEFLGSVSAFGSLYITHVFRKGVKLRPYAPLTCYMPVVGLSAIGTTLYQTWVVTRNIVSQNSCPSCVSAKATIGNLLFGLGYPLVMAPIVCFYLADRLLTYPIPPLVRAPKEVFSLFQKILRKNPRSFFVIGAIYVVSSNFITFHKYQNMKNLNIK